MLGFPILEELLFLVSKAAWYPHLVYVPGFYLHPFSQILARLESLFIAGKGLQTV